MPETRAKNIDLCPSLSRTDEQSGIVRTYTPTTRLYLADRCRLAHRLEGFHMQGIRYNERHSNLRDYNSRFLADLAGNALHTWACGAS
eukprot:9183473-Karenia_brevis.AAC.1